MQLKKHEILIPRISLNLSLFCIILCFIYNIVSFFFSHSQNFLGMPALDNSLTLSLLQVKSEAGLKVVVFHAVYEGGIGLQRAVSTTTQRSAGKLPCYAGRQPQGPPSTRLVPCVLRTEGAFQSTPSTCGLTGLHFKPSCNMPVYQLSPEFFEKQMKNSCVQKS